MAAIAIVGAGMAGLTAARPLSSRGHSVTVVDKGRSVGGRLATRRLGGATLDHGAQFFTVRTPEFAAAMAQAEEAGAVREWCRGFGPGRTATPLRRNGGDERSGQTPGGGSRRHGRHRDRVDQRRAGRWSLVHDEGAIEADALVLTPPVPQSLRLLDAGAHRARRGDALPTRPDRLPPHPGGPGRPRSSLRDVAAGRAPARGRPVQFRGRQPAQGHLAGAGGHPPRRSPAQRRSVDRRAIGGAATTCSAWPNRGSDRPGSSTPN